MSQEWNRWKSRKDNIWRNFHLNFWSYFFFHTYPQKKIEKRSYECKQSWQLSTVQAISLFENNGITVGVHNAICTVNKGSIKLKLRTVASYFCSSGKRKLGHQITAQILKLAHLFMHSALEQVLFRLFNILGKRVYYYNINI